MSNDGTIRTKSKVNKHNWKVAINNILLFKKYGIDLKRVMTM